MALPRVYRRRHPAVCGESRVLPRYRPPQSRPQFLTLNLDSPERPFAFRKHRPRLHRRKSGCDRSRQTDWPFPRESACRDADRRPASVWGARRRVWDKCCPPPPKDALARPSRKRSVVPSRVRLSECRRRIRLEQSFLTSRPSGRAAALDPTPSLHRTAGSREQGL